MLNSYETTKVLPADARKAVPDAATLAARVDYTEAKVLIRNRGPANVALCPEQLLQYTASELTEMLKGERPLPKGW